MKPARGVAFLAFMAALLSIEGGAAFSQADAPAPSFGYGSSVYVWNDEVRALSLSGVDLVPGMSARSGVFLVAYDKRAARVYSIDRSGGVRTLASTSAFAMYFSERRFLEVSLFDAGKGFLFRSGTYRPEGGTRAWVVERVFHLDCFVASVAFGPHGIFLAGADSGDREHTLYFIPDGESAPRVVARVPKRSDFARLLIAGDTLYMCFSSARTERRRETITMATLDGRYLSEASLDGGELACVYGSPFVAGRSLFVPWADGRGNVAFMEYGLGGKPEPLSRWPGAGVYHVAEGRADGATLFVGYDPRDSARIAAAYVRSPDGTLRRYELVP
jgi:hypothetical protein